ncbi:MAG: 2-hydroxychromene-2-carboxylate isomerase [Paracoccaceae bacterium]
MIHIDYYFATMSPFAYFANDGLEKVAQKHGATIAYKPLDLLALFSRTGGIAPAERHISRQEYRMQELVRNAKHAGLEINPKPAFLPVNPAPSSYAVIAAQSAGGGDVGLLARTFLRAVWAEDRDIADDAVVRDCLEKSGFDPALSDSGMLAGAETYSANLEEAVKRGVFGAPFYITDTDQRFWGHDRLDYLDVHLSGKM